MWDTIINMVTDRTWIYTGIAGAILGALFVAYMRDTTIGLWVYGKWDTLLDTVRDRFGWTWFDQKPNAWRKVNPNISGKIDELEQRIKTLEEGK